MSPNLYLRSLLVLTLLFGLLFAVGVGVMYALHVNAVYAVLFAVAIVGLQYLIAPWVIQLIYKVNWVEPHDVDPKLGAFIRSCCEQARIPVPRFGLIYDGNPNAFTFGHYPGDARVVVTTGLLGVLDERERQAVVAHELGHIAHWDFVVMTVAATVPLVLYVLWRFGLRGRGRGRGGGPVIAVALGAFIAWWISEYIVRFLSRVREYYADRFSADQTGDPNALATSLVKIAYGLAAAPKTQPQEKEAREARPALVRADAIRALGIFDPHVAGFLALAAAGQAGTASSAETMVDAMKWDVWNPWGLYYELGSTHPLPAKRIKALDIVAEERGQKPAYDFPLKPPESYWDEFLADWLVNLYPLAGLVAGGACAYLAVAHGAAYPVAIAAVLVLVGLGLLLQIKATHPTDAFPEARVVDLVGEVKVSRIRSIPCTLRGRIIGRGIPGLWWSEDLVLHDGTGWIVLDYRQPIGFLEFLFGLLRAERFVGMDVLADGWYRRGPRPYFELWHLRPAPGARQTCWNYTASLVLGWLLCAGGAMALLLGMLPR